MTLKSGKESRHWHRGQGIGQYAEADELDSVAQAAGVAPLRAFYFEDEFFYIEVRNGCAPEFQKRISDTLYEGQKKGRWHEPSEGLKTVSALLEHYRMHQKFDGAEVVLEDLEA